MALFTGIKINNQLIYDNPEGRDSFIARRIKEGERFREELIPAAPKSKKQRGYYFGFLLPEIYKQYIANGFTKTVHTSAGPIEISISEKDAHEIIKDNCALIGEEGAKLDVEVMDEDLMIFFIDNVIEHAVNDLDMNRKRLEAKRPERGNNAKHKAVKRK